MVILASASPRRQELLKILFDDFAVEPADIDETVRKSIEIEQYPEYLAVKKARHIAEKHTPDDMVIGCDTGVFIDNLMLGKPSDENQAKEMLTLLSGRTHKVITGCCIMHKGRTVSFSKVTEVEFYRLTDKEIDLLLALAEGEAPAAPDAALVRALNDKYASLGSAFRIRYFEKKGYRLVAQNE